MIVPFEPAEEVIRNVFKLKLAVIEVLLVIVNEQVGFVLPLQDEALPDAVQLEKLDEVFGVAVIEIDVFFGFDPDELPSIVPDPVPEELIVRV